MNFEQIKTKVKYYRSLMYSSIFMIVTGLALLGVTMWKIMVGLSGFTLSTLLFAGIGYAMSMAGSIAILVSQKNIRNLTKCVKCNRQIDIHDFLNMKHFKCPHCQHESYDA